MQSDRYGDIADLTKGLRVVTPSGTLVTRPVPAMSTGPSVRQMVLGSEGPPGHHHRGHRRGAATAGEAGHPRLPVPHASPPGLAAMRAHRRERVQRLGDAGLRRAARPSSPSPPARRPTLLDKLQSRALREFLVRRLGFDVEAMALSFIGYEGSEAHVARERKAVGRIVKAHGGPVHRLGPRRPL